MADIFRFKQFNVDQSGCAMKINTDGVLLGALAQADQPKTILDIGTGTGVIALIMAQRFPDAIIDAVEIDEHEAQTANKNFENSRFSQRLTIYHQGFETYFNKYPERKYDLIVSNPPFYINSLVSPKVNKSLAKHAGKYFFEELIAGISKHLSENGLCWLVLPIETAALIKSIIQQYNLYLQKTISIYSFESSEPHREILAFGLKELKEENSNFIIYKSVGIYSTDYKQLLQPYFIVF